MTAKPPLPESLFDPYPRAEIDESETSDFTCVLGVGVGAADAWLLGPTGIHATPGMTKAEITRQTVRQALLHLMELGFVDIDTERLNAAQGWPISRQPDPS